MLLDISDDHQDRADDHKSFLGPGVFEQYFDPSFESTPVRLSARDIQGGFNPVAHNLISGETLDRKPARSLVSP